MYLSHREDQCSSAWANGSKKARSHRNRGRVMFRPRFRPVWEQRNLRFVRDDLKVQDLFRGLEPDCKPHNYWAKSDQIYLVQNLTDSSRFLKYYFFLIENFKSVLRNFKDLVICFELRELAYYLFVKICIFDTLQYNYWI